MIQVNNCSFGVIQYSLTYCNKVTCRFLCLYLGAVSWWWGTPVTSCTSDHTIGENNPKSKKPDLDNEAGK